MNNAEKDPLLMRLVFLITPTNCLNQRLAAGNDHEVEPFESTVVITPELHYERHFEGWKNSWKEKAKLDFISDFIESWNDDDGSLGEIARELELSETDVRMTKFTKPKSRVRTNCMI